MENKQEWSTPELIVHGTVEELTLQVKGKQLGSKDDFNISGISDGVLP